MSPVMSIDAGTESSIAAKAAERRSRKRYPIQLEVLYRTLSRARISGNGWTVNLSSRGMMVKSTTLPVLGAKIEVRIAWPTTLDGGVPLQFVTTGKVVRVGGGGFAVLMASHEFYTSKVQSVAAS